MTKKVLILSSSPVVVAIRTRFAMNSCAERQRVATKWRKSFSETRRYTPARDAACAARDKKPCPQKDDAAEIIEKMLAADVIVMGTPVYFYAISAQMKTLIDRCCGPYTEMKNKDFYFIATAAEDDDAIMGRIVANFMGFLDCLENPTVKGRLFCGGVWHVGEIKGNPKLNEAYEMGKSC